MTNYFTQILNNKTHPTPQSLLFYGNDLESQYILANEIARILNCKEDKSDDCQCLNCNWIRNHSHPAVLTYSRVDNKPSDDDAKTVISIKQSQTIKESLVHASDFHRVFIFCDKDDNNNIQGLNFKNFQAEAANSLLKIIEEPQPGVTFIFLTRYIDDILSTIISRSQCFFVPNLKEPDFNYDLIKDVFENYWNFDRKNLFDISKKLESLAKEHSTILVLENIQNYILTVLKNNHKNLRFIEDIKEVEKAKKEALLGIKPQNIFDNLCLNLIK